MNLTDWLPVFEAADLKLLADTMAEVGRRADMIRAKLAEHGDRPTHLVVPTEDADMGALVANLLGLKVLAHGWCPKGNWFTVDEREAKRSVMPPLS